MGADAESYEAQAEEIFGDELPQGTELLQGQYKLTRFLNAGGFGITYLAKDSLDRTVVIKECFPASMCCRRQRSVRVRSETMQPDFQSIVKCFGREARALARLKHPNIVGVHQVFEDNQTAYMALDFVKGRDLLDIIQYEPGRFGPEDIRRMLMRLLSAVAYIHDRGILHRDISPDNILIDDSGNPVLIDFGAAREEATRRTRMVTQQATVKDGYSPQEFYIAGAKQTPASDLYALAATFYHLITGEAPPVSQLRLSTVAEGSRDPYVPLYTNCPDFDQYFLKAIDKCLSVFPKDRILSAQEWQAEIDAERRHMVARERAEDDVEMHVAISELVKETNEAVKKGIGAGEPVKKVRIHSRNVSRPREDRWKKFQDLNDGTAVQPEKNGANSGDTAASTETDAIVRKRVRKRTLIGKVLGGVLRRSASEETTTQGVAER